MQQMHKHGESGEDFNDLNLFPALLDFDYNWWCHIWIYLMDRSFYINWERGSWRIKASGRSSLTAGLGSVHPETVTTLVRLKNSQQSWVLQRKIAVGGALGSKQHVSNTCWTQKFSAVALDPHIRTHTTWMIDRFNLNLKSIASGLNCIKCPVLSRGILLMIHPQCGMFLGGQPGLQQKRRNAKLQDDKLLDIDRVLSAWFAWIRQVWSWLVIGHTSIALERRPVTRKV